MRLLLDQNLAPALVDALTALGHDTIHVRDLGLSRAADIEILATAREQGRVLVSSDTDFGELLARTNAESPSIVLLRRQGHRRAAHIATLLDSNLGTVGEDLEAGAIVVFDTDRIRVRRLPMWPSS